MPVDPAPIVVDPSGDFLGNDGAWSTFLINAGSPPQQVQVLASTEVAASWVVAPAGCGSGDAVNCTQARGGVYDESQSSTWNIKSIFQLGAETNLGSPYTGNEDNGTFGYDTLGLPGQPGGANVSLDHQVIAGITTKNFFLGHLGLSSQSINFTAGGDSSPSVITSLKNKNLIPSLSYGYTAGASYQHNGVNASLTLGGYDASRFTPNDVSFTFAPTLQRQLVVGLQSITYSDSKTQTPLLSQGILALVDSTVPHFWLPEQACQAFESAFGITWDPLHSLYLVNDTLHDTLVKSNPSVIFELANSPTGGSSVNISLPYASFDLEASSPLVKNASRYFPLQRANDDSSYTLGRAFFQESFIIVDYEASNFSISQSVFNANTPNHIVAISHDSNSGTGTGSTTSNATSSNPAAVKVTGNGSHGVSTGAIAGIAIAIVLIAMLCGGFFVYRNIQRRRRSKKHTNLAELKGDEPPSGNGSEMVKTDFSDDLEAKKTTTITVAEVPMTPPLSEIGNSEFFAPEGDKQPPNNRDIILPAYCANRSELSSPGLWAATPELPSPDQIRSELSTPEPLWPNSELPTPDPSWELPSPNRSPSPGDRRSNVSLAELPDRPTSERFDSSESGFTPILMPRRPSHHRLNSSTSDARSSPSRLRYSRMDSSDSEGGGLFHLNRLGKSSDSDSLPPVARPSIAHLDSSESESGGISSPSTSSASLRPRASQNSNNNNSSESESNVSSPSSSSSSRKHTLSSTSTRFHSSTSSRPSIIRRSLYNANPIPRPQSAQLDSSSDSEAGQTRYISSSSDESGNVTRSNTTSTNTNISRHSRGDSNGVAETREGLLGDDDVAEEK